MIFIFQASALEELNVQAVIEAVNRLPIYNLQF